MKKALALLALLAGALLFSHHKTRPRYVFINLTDDHSHDLALKMSLKLAEKRSGIENALILLRELPEGRTIEELTESEFRRWDIGRERGGRGILYLYSEKENRFRIEVSYALEGDLPDALCRRLEEAAKTYLLSEVPQDFLSETIITMNLSGAERADSVDAWMSKGPLSGGAGAEVAGFRRDPAEIAQAIRKSPSPREFLPSRNAKTVLHGYLRSLNEGLGDPDLALLTTGSAVFRTIVPRTPPQLRRMARDYATPHRLAVQGDWALAVFEAKASLPIVLRRARDARWYVDEPKAWTWFHRFEDGDRFVPRYADLPVKGLFALPEAIYRDRLPVPVPPAYPYPMEEALSQLTAERLGDFYRFEMNWLSRAIAAYELAARQSPDEPRLHWRLWDVYVDNSEMEKALGELDTLARLLPHDPEVQRWRQFYRAQYAEVQ